MHYSTLKQINTANVGTLQVAWTYDTGDANGNPAPLVPTCRSIR